MASLNNSGIVIGGETGNRSESKLIKGLGGTDRSLTNMSDEDLSEERNLNISV